MAFSFRGAHTARGSFCSQLSSQCSSGRLESSLGRITSVPSIVSRCSRYPAQAEAYRSHHSVFCLHKESSHEGTSSAAAANRAGSRRGTFPLASQLASSPDAPSQSSSSSSPSLYVPSRQSAVSCSAIATSSQEAQSTAAFQMPPTYVKAAGRIVASNHLTSSCLLSPYTIPVCLNHG